MKKIFSKIQPDLLLHIVSKVDDINSLRRDLCPANELIQVATLQLPLGKTFKPHKHIQIAKTTHTTQESWVVIRGQIKAILYDIDDTILSEEILNPGDASITFQGGHNYLALEESSLVYEYKTGPYFGQSQDKVFI